jgi:uncharacterized protein (TIGR00255 family)
VPAELALPVESPALRMIQSMTGYGRADGRYKGRPVTVEVRSVNHRHCEIVTRLPKALQPYEERLRKRVQAYVRRGRVDLNVSFFGENDISQTLYLDRRLARQYLKLLKELQQALGLSGSPDLALVAGYRDVIKAAEQPSEDQHAVQAAERILCQALKALARMRRAEGHALERDLMMRLHEIDRRMAAVRDRLPEIGKELYQRMQARVNRLLQEFRGSDERIEPARLAQEMAILADRSDVSEEVTRLASHVRQFRSFLRKSEAVGRSLEFLLQEMNREVTTLGSKVSDLSVSQDILVVKAELEKIREQVQNVE